VLCVVKGSGLCDELITRSEESYRLCVCVYLETSIRRRPRPGLGCCITGKERINTSSSSSSGGGGGGGGGSSSKRRGYIGKY
jgi:hypothetical protein